MNDTENRTCRYCGHRFDTVADREAHIPCPETTGDTEVPEIEAIQFAEWKPWHAVVPDADGTGSNRTYCGRSALKALRMYEKWTDFEGDQCRNCLRAMS